MRKINIIEDNLLKNRKFRILFNKRLLEIQRILKYETLKIEKKLLARVKNNNDIMYDYTLEQAIIFYLSEKDKDWNEDADNILFEIPYNEIYYNLVISHTVNELWDENENLNLNPENYEKEHYCYLMHIIKTHLNINDEILKKVGDIDLDIKVKYQWSFKQKL